MIQSGELFMKSAARMKASLLTLTIPWQWAYKERF